MEAPLGDLPRALEVQRFAAAREVEVLTRRRKQPMQPPVMSLADCLFNYAD